MTVQQKVAHTVTLDIILDFTIAALVIGACYLAGAALLGGRSKRTRRFDTLVVLNLFAMSATNFQQDGWPPFTVALLVGGVLTAGAFAATYLPRAGRGGDINGDTTPTAQSGTTT